MYDDASANMPLGLGELLKSLGPTHEVRGNTHVQEKCPDLINLIKALQCGLSAEFRISTPCVRSVQSHTTFHASLITEKSLQ